MRNFGFSCDILDARYHTVQEEIKGLKRKIEGPVSRQIRLDGKIEGEPQQIKLDSIQWTKQVESLKVELERIQRPRSALKTIRDVPFVWDIAFVEIFEGERGGFDIVIGNPPYVRQENIADPHLSREEVATENKGNTKQNWLILFIRPFRGSSATAQKPIPPLTNLTQRVTFTFIFTSTGFRF